MKCTGYITSQVGKGISPLYNVEITIDNDGLETEFNKLKKLIESNLSQEDLLASIKELFPTGDYNFETEDNVLIYEKGGEHIEISFNTINLLEDLSMNRLLQSTSIKDKDVDPNSRVVFLLADEFDRLYNKEKNGINKGAYLDKSKEVVIRIADISHIKLFKNYLNDYNNPDRIEDEGFESYIYNIKHEFKHQLIENSPDFENQRNVIENFDNYLREQTLIGASLPTYLQPLNLFLKGTTNVPQFFSEVFVQQELDPKVKEIVEKELDLNITVRQSQINKPSGKTGIERTQDINNLLFQNNYKAGVNNAQNLFKFDESDPIFAKTLYGTTSQFKNIYDHLFSFNPNLGRQELDIQLLPALISFLEEIKDDINVNKLKKVLTQLRTFSNLNIIIPQATENDIEAYVKANNQVVEVMTDVLNQYLTRLKMPLISLESGVNANDIKLNFNSIVNDISLGDLIIPEDIAKDKAFGIGDQKAYKEYLDIAYQPYLEMDPDSDIYRNQILSFRKGELIYAQWTIKGKEMHPGHNFVESVKVSGNDIILEVSKRGYESEKAYDQNTTEDNRKWVKKKIIIKPNGSTSSSDFQVKIVAVRKFSGKPSSINKDGVLEIQPSEKVNAAIEANVALWVPTSKRLKNTKIIWDYQNEHKLKFNIQKEALIRAKQLHVVENEDQLPKFIDSSVNQIFDGQNSIGMYFHIDDTTSKSEIQNVILNVNSTVPALQTSSNNYALSDASFDLIKTGDVVEFDLGWDTTTDTTGKEKFSKSKTEGVVIKTFAQGLAVKKINADGSIDPKYVIVQRKSLIKAYVFFNEKSTELPTSPILAQINEFDALARKLYDARTKNTVKEKETLTEQEIKELNQLSKKENLTEGEQKRLNYLAETQNTLKDLERKSFTLKDLMTELDYDVNSFRSYNKKDDPAKDFSFKTTNTFLQVSKSVVDFIYDGKSLPSKEYQQFERVMDKANAKVKKQIREGKPYSSDLEEYADEKNNPKLDRWKKPIVVSEEAKRFLNSKVNNAQYLEMYDVKKHRRDKLNTLKAGSYVLLNTPKKSLTAGKWVVSETERSVVYGFIIQKSNDFLTVAIPDMKYIHGVPTYDNFKFIEVNAMDFRGNKAYDITKVFNNVKFEKTLISVLRSANANAKKSWSTKSVNEDLLTQLDDVAAVRSIMQKLETQGGINLTDQKALQVKALQDVWTKVTFFTNLDYGFKDNKEVVDLPDYELQARKSLRDLYVSMLETGSIVYYKLSSFLEDKDKTEKKKGYIKCYIVIGKDINSGKPILAEIQTTNKNGYDTHYVKSFVPDIDSIVGVGLLKTDVLADTTETDGSTSIIKINANDRFKDDLVDLLKSYVRRQQPMEFQQTEEQAAQKISEIEAKQEKFKWKRSPDLQAMITVEATSTYNWKTPSGASTSKTTSRRIQVKKVNTTEGSVYLPLNPKDTKYTIVPDTEKIAVYQNWGNGWKPYTGHDYHQNFVVNRDPKANKGKGDWQTPQGLRIIDKLRRGTVINFEYEINGRTQFDSGIVLYKDDREVMLLKFDNTVDNIQDIDIDDINYDHVRMVPLYFKTVQTKDGNNPEFALVLSGIRSIEFTEGADKDEFKKISAAANSFKQGTNHELVYDKNQVKNYSLLQDFKKDKEGNEIEYLNVKYNKQSFDINETVANVEELRKYQEKFEKLYGIKFRLLSTQEISEEFDHKKQFNYNIISAYNAFKYEGSIIINTDKASLQAPFHEMQHFVIEALSLSNKPLYEALLNATRQHPLYSNIKERYPELSGVDLDEEVFSTVLGITYSNKSKTVEVNEWEQKNKTLLGDFLEWLKEQLRRLGRKMGNINPSHAELVMNSNKDILYQFGEDLEQGKFARDLNNSKAYIGYNDDVVFGHPGIGKTFLSEFENNIIDFDSAYKPSLNVKYNLSPDYKARNEWRKNNEQLWNQSIKELWVEAKQDAKKAGKILFASDMILLREFPNDFDKVITMSKETFIERSKQRNDYTEGSTEGWKTNLDDLIGQVDQSKVVTTDQYLSELIKPRLTSTMNSIKKLKQDLIDNNNLIQYCI